MALIRSYEPKAELKVSNTDPPHPLQMLSPIPAAPLGLSNANMASVNVAAPMPAISTVAVPTSISQKMGPPDVCRVPCKRDSDQGVEERVRIKGARDCILYRVRDRFCFGLYCTAEQDPQSQEAEGFLHCLRLQREKLGTNAATIVRKNHFPASKSGVLGAKLMPLCRNCNLRAFDWSLRSASDVVPRSLLLIELAGLPSGVPVRFGAEVPLLRHLSKP